MRFISSVIFTLLFASPSFTQETFPVNGVHDERNIYHAFTNARIHVSPGYTVDSATLLIHRGKVVSVGKNTLLPSGTVKHNCQGQSIYPSFIDAHAGFNVERKKKGGAKKEASDPSTAMGWNPAIHPEHAYTPTFPVSQKTQDDWLASGIGIVNVHDRDGIMRGSSALFHIGIDQANQSLISPKASQEYSFSKGSSPADYPSSHMGAIALFRQTLYDARWYEAAGQSEEINLSLDAVNRHASSVKIFALNNPLSYRNVQDLEQEFGWEFILVGTGKEYLVKDHLRPGMQLIEPVILPKAYDVQDPYDARLISLEELKHWESAPFNVRMLMDEGHSLALSRDTIRSQKEFLKNLQKIAASGISPERMLASLTTVPAQMLKVDDRVGSLENGKLANFFVASDELPKEGFEVVEHWNKGERVYRKESLNENLAGVYNLVIEKRDYTFTIEKITEKGVKARLAEKKTEKEVACKVALEDELITIVMFTEDDELLFQLSGKFSLGGSLIDGRGQSSDGAWVTWAAVKDREEVESKKKQEEIEHDSLFVVPQLAHPNRAYGWDSLDRSNTFVLTNAVVWTCADTGVLEQADIWVENGKIKRVGKGSLYPTDLPRVDVKGRHVTPGIIDEHSHIALRGGVNEGSQSSSAEVRIQDAIDPWSIHIFRQLGGGVTAAQLLHGSANPIGGQSALVKFKWGASAEEMLIDSADGFIKFALGENVKRSNSRNNRGRFPLTRMGVEQTYVDAFTRAKEYYGAQTPPPSPKRRLLQREPVSIAPTKRKDLELDALAEILNQQRFITCHSYVQSEILMLMNVADSFGFNVNTFTHILEGYKVADKMVDHGVAASTFSDWWAYKFEVNDAIPYNAALMSKVGVMTAINSDDAEMGRRLNQEAAKGMKYGGMSAEEALKMVTINPAKMLHLDDRIGSIEVGKDADFVIWSDMPLSVYAHAQQTFIEGVKYFDAQRLAVQEKNIAKERSRIIAEMLKDTSQKKQKVKAKEKKDYHCDTILEDYMNE